MPNIKPFVLDVLAGPYIDPVAVFWLVVIAVVVVAAILIARAMKKRK